MLLKDKNNNNQESENLPISEKSFGRLILIGILICATLVNIVQFYPIDYHIPGWNYSVLNSYGTNNLTEISMKLSGGTPVVLFSPYLGLSQVAPGANVLLPLDCPLITQSLYGLGRVANVERLNYDARTLIDNFDPAYYNVKIFGRTDERGPGEVAIVTGENKASNLIVLWRDEMWYLIDLEILTGNGVEESFR